MKNYHRQLRFAPVAVVAAIVLTSCGPQSTPVNEDRASSLSGSLVGAGSSAQGSAQAAWISAFEAANPDVAVNYEATGSGAGRESFIAGDVDFGGSDSFLKAEEIENGFAGCVAESGYIEVPVYISPIAVIFNVEGVSQLNMDSATIAAIFKGTVTSWRDPAIVVQNPEADLPEEAIAVIHRADDSGTTKNFADYLSKTAAAVWDAPVSDTFPYLAGKGADQTKGVVAAVVNGENTIGYADASQAGDLGVVSLKVGDQYVPYTAEAAAAVVAGSPFVESRPNSDLAINLNRSTIDPEHYPLVLVTYIIACAEYESETKGELVKAYLNYLTSASGQDAAAFATGSAPMTPSLSARVLTVVASIR